MAEDPNANATMTGGEQDDIEQNMEFAPMKRSTATQGEVNGLIQAMGSSQNELAMDEEERRFVRDLLHREGRCLYGIGAYTIYVWKKPCLAPVGSTIRPEVLSKVPLNERNLVADAPDAYPNVDIVGEDF